MRLIDADALHYVEAGEKYGCGRVLEKIGKLSPEGQERIGLIAEGMAIQADISKKEAAANEQ